jgi:hypothetical protein
VYLYIFEFFPSKNISFVPEFLFNRTIYA